MNVDLRDLTSFSILPFIADYVWKNKREHRQGDASQEAKTNSHDGFLCIRLSKSSESICDSHEQ